MVVNRGKHNRTVYREQAVDTVTIASEIAVYTMDAAGATQLFYATEAGGLIHQWTFPFTSAQEGTFVLGGGIRLAWGRATIGGGGTIIALTFPVAFSAAPYIVNPFTMVTTDRIIFPTLIVAAGFSITATAAVAPAGIECGYFAIGPV